MTTANRHSSTFNPNAALAHWKFSSKKKISLSIMLMDPNVRNLHFYIVFSCFFLFFTVFALFSLRVFFLLLLRKSSMAFAACHQSGVATLSSSRRRPRTTCRLWCLKKWRKNFKWKTHINL